MTLQPRRDAARAGEQQDGFVLLAVLFMLVLVLLTLSIAAPQVATNLRRDKETEAIERGKQYTRAIRLYYRKYGRYPNTIDQLMNTDNQRFLRKRYLDPLTGKDDWRLIHVGEAHVASMGFFGQATTQVGTPIGVPPAGGTGASPFGSSSGSTGSAGSTSIFGSPASANPTDGSGTSATGSSGSSPFGSSGSSGLSGSSPFGSASGSSITGSPSSGGTGSMGTSASGGSAFGSPGATLGGAPIVGVGLPVNKSSLKTYNKQTRYNLWEFVYDPSQELAAAAGLTGGAGITQTGADSGTTGTMPGIGGGNSPSSGPGGNSGFGNGGSNSGSGFGGAPGSSGNPGGGTPPDSPTNPRNSF